MDQTLWAWTGAPRPSPPDGVPVRLDGVDAAPRAVRPLGPHAHGGVAAAAQHLAARQAQQAQHGPLVPRQHGAALAAAPHAQRPGAGMRTSGRCTSAVEEVAARFALVSCARGAQVATRSSWVGEHERLYVAPSQSPPSELRRQVGPLCSSSSGERGCVINPASRLIRRAPCPWAVCVSQRAFAAARAAGPPPRAAPSLAHVQRPYMCTLWQNLRLHHMLWALAFQSNCTGQRVSACVHPIPPRPARGPQPHALIQRARHDARAPRRRGRQQPQRRDLVLVALQSGQAGGGGGVPHADRLVAGAWEVSRERTPG